MTSPEPCNHTSVGVLVVRDGRLLLIERARPPYAWAPPAGHVDDGETSEQAAARELQEEVGLTASRLTLVHRGPYRNQCRRPGGDRHHWEVFTADAEGDPVRSETETSSLRWVTPGELAQLRAISRAHLVAGASVERWREQPGLEPVWMRMLMAIGLSMAIGGEWW